MAVTSWIRRQFKNGVITTATTTMTGAATTFTVNTGAGTTFPDGSVGPFIVTVDQLLAAEEKILCSSRSGDTFTVAASGRGYNGTTAQAHTAAVVLHTLDQQDLDEANQVANQTLGAISATGDLLQGSGANTLARLARGTNGQYLQSGASNLSWVTPTNFAPSGLTGATAASRYVGATTSGAPVSGTFSTGDFIIDQSGLIWVCTAGGTPGTWVKINNTTTFSDATVATLEHSTGSSYGDLATSGPAVTITTGTQVFITLNASIGNTVDASGNYMGYAVSGATTLAATDTTALLYTAAANGSSGVLQQYGMRQRLTGLTAGSNTFTAKYRTLGGTAAFSNRYLLVEPI